MIAVEDVASECSDHRPVLKDFVLWELSSGSGCCLYLSFLWMEEFYHVFFNLVTDNIDNIDIIFHAYIHTQNHFVCNTRRDSVLVSTLLTVYTEADIKLKNICLKNS